MLFNSYHFLFFFLPLVLLGAHLLSRFGGPRAAVAFLGAASLAFYGADYPQFLPVIAVSVLGNFALGTSMARMPHHRRALMWAGVAGNLLLLGYFKYLHFLAGLAGFDIAAIALAMGIVFFALGLAKKVLVADSLSPYVGQLYAAPHTLSMAEGWLAALLYSLQLYFDFSGYSEMAVGLALMLNVRIPINFNAPYKATSMIAFWQRWHISLSRFLRDYLYIPLGGNRKGEARRYAHIFITMLLGGIWHGAGWTFVAWGAIHASAITANHAWRALKLGMPRWLGWLLTLWVVVHGWVFFRAASMQDALLILKAMYGGAALTGGPLTQAQLIGPACFWLAAGWLIVLCAPRVRRLALMRRPHAWLCFYTALLLVFSVLQFGKVSEFLYFQF